MVVRTLNGRFEDHQAMALFVLSYSLLILVTNDKKNQIKSNNIIPKVKISQIR